MNKELIKKKYLLKIKEYQQHNKLYYDENRPKIKDYEYDKLKNEIINLEKNYKFLSNKYSPSKSVGYKASKSFEKYKQVTENNKGNLDFSNIINE